MNKMTCSFENEAQLHSNIVNETNREIAFLIHSEETLRVFEKISVRLNVDNVNATNQVLGRIVRRQPIAQAPDTPQVWEYTVRLDAIDKVWFEAFVNEVETLSIFNTMST